MPAGASSRPLVASLREAAVALVDLSSGLLVDHNPTARALAPVRLPTTFDEWADAVDLADADGPLRLRTREDLCRTLERGGTLPGPASLLAGDGGRRPVWVVADALVRIGEPDRRQALVVLLPVTEVSGATPVASDPSELHRRAVAASTLSFTVSDPRLEDNPLVWVNQAFTTLTGYPADEALGRNCRFLQTDHTEPQAVAELRAAIRERRSSTQVLLNRRRDGSLFWNEVALSPIFTPDDELVGFVGMQSDVTRRVEVERAQAAAQRAAEAANERLSLLARVSEALAGVVDVEEALQRLAGVLVPSMADWCVINVLEPGGRLRRAALRHASAPPDVTSRFEVLYGGELAPTSIAARVAAGGPAVLVAEVAEEHLARFTADPELRALVEHLGARSAIVAPLVSRHVTGTLTLVRSDGDRGFDGGDFEVVQDIGRRAGLHVETARLFTREHELAEALQQQLLPALPELEDVELCATYLASSVTAGSVGGDWYDVLRLPDGSIALAVGDVVGHDANAAAAMGQLSSVLRSYAYDARSPAEVIAKMNRLITGLDMGALATCFYARLEVPLADGSRRLTWCNAGHVPPVVRRVGAGGAELLEDGANLMLGVDDGPVREATTVLRPGDLLVAFTDGLVEERGVDLGVSLDRIRRGVEAWEGGSPSDLCESLTRQAAGAVREDDVCLLVARLGPAADDATPAPHAPG